MCGIFGHISFDELAVNRNLMPHRGPDDWGVSYFSLDNKKITLHQSRLSIIGLGEQGHQPYEKYKGYSLVFNGEIYNYQKIRDKLIEEYGFSFQTETDTEVLYECLINLGYDKTLELLNGIFAFAFLNYEKGELLLARDPMGIKPLYYYSNKDKFIFSSEAKVFFELNLVEPVLNAACIGEYFANGWIYEPETMFKDVYKVESGCYLLYHILSEKIQNLKYWDLTAPEGKRGSVNIPEIIVNQTVADVPIGLYLSGGIDSSILAYTLKNADVLNLNLDMQDAESERVRLMEKIYGLKVQRIFPESFSLDLIEKLIYHLDEPMADAAIIPAYALAKASRKEKRIVMLSGMGGDEIDGGYPRHLILKYLKFLKGIKWIPNWVFNMASGRVKRDLLRLKNFMDNPVPENYFSLTSYLSKTEIDHLINKEWFDGYSKKLKPVYRSYPGFKSFIALDFKGFLSSHNLVYMDKASMAASIEVRVPLLDKDLVQVFFKDMERFTGKKRLIKLLKTQLGEHYKPNQKKGFRYPIRKWLKDDILWPEVYDYFDNNKILNTSVIKTWVNELNKGADTEMKLWPVYVFYLWMKIFKVRY